MTNLRVLALVGAFLALSAIVAPLHWATAAPKAVTLTDGDRADIRRIEQYLNDLKTMRARILQVSSGGQFAEGDLYISRPGRLRLDYDPPVPILIVADGTWFIYYDEELSQVSYVPLGATPASILTREDVRFFDGDFVITDFESDAGTVRVTVVQADDPQAGSVTLVFDANPVNLRKWSVLDAQGVETQVTLLTARYDVPLNPELFQFANPKFVPDSYPSR